MLNKYKSEGKGVELLRVLFPRLQQKSKKKGNGTEIQQALAGGSLKVAMAGGKGKDCAAFPTGAKPQPN
jgi:hypothetical protein